MSVAPELDRRRQPGAGAPAVTAAPGNPGGGFPNPQQNAFAESFIGRLREECLNETLFSSLAHAGEALIE
jgi:hypothetical protein